MCNAYFNKKFIGANSDTIAGDRIFTGDTTIKAPIVSNNGTAVNVTGSISASALAGGLITSTSAAAVTATLPTATDFATEIGAARGTVFDFLVDNISGANTVTVAVNTGITAGTAVLTGSSTLTVGSGVVGAFRLIFTSATAAKLFRTS